MADAIARQAGIDPLVAQVLAGRGVQPDAAARYLAPALRDLLPDPMILRDMGIATDRLLAALRGRERIAIFADYDVDGGASAALMLTWLRALGHDATLYIPDRIDEGYGPNVPAMQALADDHGLIICVDCGTLSHDPIAAACARGADVVVLDHHLGIPDMPPALAIVNPNRADEPGDLGHLCAAGVVFLVLVEANRRLRAENQTGPDLMGYLDLVALATVADVAPLVGVNRAFVRQGLAVMARTPRAGIAALATAARLTGPPDSGALGFALGPRVNAGGRIGKADLGARLLATTNPAEAQALAERLEQLNSDRRAIEAVVRAEALAQHDARAADSPLAWAAADLWHPGVIGIVAARLKEATGLPSVVMGIDETGEVKGSARSVPGVDLGAAVQRLAAEGLIARGGGHRMAAGLSLAKAQIAPAMARLAELIAAQQADAPRPETRILRLDGLLAPGAARVDLVGALERAGPFGAAAPAPRFALADQIITATRKMGDRHLRLTLGRGDTRLEVVAFGAFDSPLGPALSSAAAGRWHLAGRLEHDTWGGRSRVQMRLEDAAKADPAHG